MCLDYSKLLFIFLFILHVVVTKERSYSVQIDEHGGYRLVKAVTDNPKLYIKTKESHVFVKASYSQDINETGWGFLEINSNDDYSDQVQAYTAGFIEGAVTHDLIYMHWYNTLGDYCEGRSVLCQKIDHFLNENIKFVDNMVKTHAGIDAYWYQVMLFYKQLQGLADGYAHSNKNRPTILAYKDLLWLNMQGDFEDLEEIFKNDENGFKIEKSRKVLGDGHCSALVKVLADGSDLFVSQETWSSYQSMLRLQKKYNLPLKSSPGDSGHKIPGQEMTFSSYPGVITSGDDFYLTSAGLVTMETTIGNSNTSLWQYVTPFGKVLEGVRSMVANRLAKTGMDWTKIFSKQNSGTYNNQWMIVDYKRFKPGTKPQDLKDDLLWIVEQIPGYIIGGDRTNVLRNQSYWPSYNVASFKDIFDLSGNQVLVDKFGDWFTYENNPRARIFRRDHAKVHDLKSMLALMRYNDFKHDPLSRCNCTPPFSAENAIAARCDLNPANGTYPFSALGHRSHGATDAKVTSTSLFFNGLRFLAVSGPVYNSSLGLPPFQWSKTDFGLSTPHMGHPDLWTFSPLVHEWA